MVVGALSLENHIYQADALQLETMRETNSDVLLTGDKKLAKIARTDGVEAFCLEKEDDREKLRGLL